MADEYELNDPAKAAAANPVTDQTWVFGALEGTAAYMTLNAQVFN